MNESFVDNGAEWDDGTDFAALVEQNGCLPCQRMREGAAPVCVQRADEEQALRGAEETGDDGFDFTRESSIMGWLTQWAIMTAGATATAMVDSFTQALE